jgi:hypothetical protein
VDKRIGARKNAAMQTTLRPPWTASGGVIRDASDRTVAILAYRGDRRMAELIAAAPELLHAARRVDLHFGGMQSAVLAEIRALLARIDGAARAFPPSSGGDGDIHERRATAMGIDYDGEPD